jgi:hypothetical protein
MPLSGCSVPPAIVPADGGQADPAAQFAKLPNEQQGTLIVGAETPAGCRKGVACHSVRSLAEEMFDGQILPGAFLHYRKVRGRELYRQPTRGGFSTVGTIVTIHRLALQDRSSWTERTMPKNPEPFKLTCAACPLYWARRQRAASRKLLVSTVCTRTSMTSSDHARTVSAKH